MDSVLHTLPPAWDFSPVVVSFLDDKFQTEENLSQPRALVSELETQYLYLDQNLIDLNRSYPSSLLFLLRSNPRPLRRYQCPIDRSRIVNTLSCFTTADGGGGERHERTEQILGEELPALAKEVARVETVRMYAAFVVVKPTIDFEVVLGEVLVGSFPPCTSSFLCIFGAVRKQ